MTSYHCHRGVVGMMRLSKLSLIATSAFFAAFTASYAAPFGAPAQSTVTAVERAGAHKTPGAKVKGYLARRGGYSYYAEDSINTYGDSRSKYGSASSYRDPSLDKQTDAGPFDHGFFFDSAIGRHGGDAPYMN
jgi:hypothetical protein